MIGPHIRKKVADRAFFRCEYCLMKESESFLPFHVDHVIAVKHGGGNEMSNLAYACPHCNQHKGTDLATYLDEYNDIVGLFQPRLHTWTEHFGIEGGEIIPLSRRGAATIKLLRFNTLERLLHRKLLIELGFYP